MIPNNDIVFMMKALLKKDCKFIQYKTKDEYLISIEGIHGINIIYDCNSKDVTVVFLEKRAEFKICNAGQLRNFLQILISENNNRIEILRKYCKSELK